MQPLRIMQVAFIETGTYNDMSYRPFVSEIKPADVTSLQEAINGHRRISGTGLAGIAGRILAPAAVPMGPVGIAGGWDTRRFRFMMEVDIPGHFGVMKEIVTGYTNYVGASASQHLDPNMELYINSVTTLRESIEDRGWGPQSYWVPADNSQILYGEYNPSFNNYQSMPSTMRPMDIFDTVGISQAPPDAFRIDQRTTFSEGPRKSRRSNSTAPDYLARVLTSAQNAFISDEVGDTASTMSSASDTVAEKLIAEDYFIGQFQKRGAFMPNSALLYSSLTMYDPTLDQQRVHVFMRGQSGQVGSAVHNRGSTAHWGGSNMETVIASILAQSVPAVMTDNLITKLELEFTNRTLDGRFALNIMQDERHIGVAGFIRNMDLTVYVARMMHRLEYEIMNDLARGGSIDIAGTMMVDVLGETWIRLSIGGQPHVDFVYPTFSDALMAPVMAPSQQQLGDLSGKMGALFNTVNTARALPSMPMANNIINPYGGDYGTSGSL